jgi:thymidylate synthase
MKQYLDLLSDILENGESRDDRTGTGTLSVFARQMRFNLQEGFPAVTTKKLAWKACVSELLWFLEGSQDERRLAEILHGTRDESKTTIWTPNAQSEYWKPKAKFDGDLGRVYGVQWRSWNPHQVQWTSSSESEPVYIDQITNLIKGLKEDPNGRRHIVSAWNVGELDQMGLPPCHVMFQMHVSKDKKLSCHMYMRSNDVLLGAPFNYASYALLTHMIAQVCGFGVGELIVTTGDTHLYLNHLDQAKEQLTRKPYDLPKLWLNPDIKNIDDFTMDDIKLENYQCHASIKAPMAV